MSRDSNQNRKLSIAEQAILTRTGDVVAMSPYMDGLNEEQKLAVTTTEGPLLVLAGAGTGKTRVLTTRIAHILQQRLAWHREILAVTFTNKAAFEMSERVQNMINDSDEKLPWLGTFHSIGAKMLRQHAELVGLTDKFIIIDKDDQVRVLKDIIKAYDIDQERWPARLLLNLIDYWKNRAKWPKNIGKGESEMFADGMGRKLYKIYQDRLLTLNACDFGDLLLHPIEIFKKNNDVLEKYKKQFKYILVDEYQDTNVAQYQWLKLIAGEEGKINICCVGDDDQSIYGWRGAQVKNILNFEKEFIGTEVIKLERNYRSTESILGCASHLIDHNESRLGKTLYPDGGQEKGEKVKVCSYPSGIHEAVGISADIEAFMREGCKLNEIAVLVRTSAQMRLFEKRFVEMGLNYRVFGGPRFYERMEIRDAIAYFRGVYQPQDDLAFERIVNKPKRGLGDTTMQIIRIHARAQKISMMESAQELVETDEIKPKQRETLKSLLASFSVWRKVMDDIELSELARMILDESEYINMWRNDSSIKAPERVENLQELVNAMREFKTLEEFLDHVGLVMENNTNANQDAVTLSSLHAAKGLEFETVFLPGWEEKLLPHKRSLEESGKDGLEEERRLAYVGITRAKYQCHISFAARRMMFDKAEEEPYSDVCSSRFINELSSKHIQFMKPNDTYIDYGHTISNESGAIKMINAPVEPKLSKNNDFSVGERVFHAKFGYGIIMDINENGFKINFKNAGMKNTKNSFIRKIGQENEILN